MNAACGHAFVVADTPIRRLRGLLFTSADDFSDRILVITPCSSIHTFGMRYAIDVAFCDEHGLVRSVILGLPPRRTASFRGARMVLERPAAEGAAWFDAGDTVLLSIGKK